VVAKYEAGLYPFIEERFPKVFEDLKEKGATDDDRKTADEEALTAYGEEFKDTIK
jgi:F-type H+-transporting ATPase subunit alpha